MEIALGFVISVFIGLTGVGAGSMTTPLLIMLLGMPAAEAVGTALIFSAVVKILTTPMYIARREVDWKALLLLLATGLPGVLGGSLLFRGIRTSVVTAAVGATIVSIALLNLFRFSKVTRHDRKPWLMLVGLPIGAEVGFSSAGAGALGALSLMSLTTLSPAAIVGTDLAFGLVLSVIGGGIHAAMGDLNTGVLSKLLIGGTVGAIAGAVLSSRLPSKKLRFALCLVLVALGLQLTYTSVNKVLAENASRHPSLTPGAAVLQLTPPAAQPH
jgi:uncharacterized membrane protein YfcA